MLINPNTSRRSTEMMVGVARAAAPEGCSVTGATAVRGAPIILDAAALRVAAAETFALGCAHRDDCDGIVVSAFADPGVAQLQDALAIPVVGIGEAAMREAAQDERKFGIATIASGLDGGIAAQVIGLGLAGQFSGLRLAPGDAATLAANPAALADALAEAVRDCIERDGAACVVIGGGPLSHAAAVLARRFAQPIIAPVPAAMRRVLALVSAARRRNA